MKPYSNASQSEKGQALVLIVLAIVGLFAFAALAVDVSMILATRRDAQNAADAAALSAAFAKCNGENLFNAAVQTAADNGYTSSEVATVQVNNPPASGPYAGQGNYIEVVITTLHSPMFSHMITNQPLEETVQAVSVCEVTAGGGEKVPALGGETSMLALSETATNGVSNSGSSTIRVYGGIYVNSNKPYAFHQNGSAKTYMHWLKVRGGATSGGSFGIHMDGTGISTRQIDIGGNYVLTGSGDAFSGPTNIGGNLELNGSNDIEGGPLNVGGYLRLTGATNIRVSSLNVVGFVHNTASGSIRATQSNNAINIGGCVLGSGSAEIQAPTVNVKGNHRNDCSNASIRLEGSAKIKGTVNYEGTIATSGSGKIDSPPKLTTVTAPTVTVDVPVMPDPLKDILQPPTPPTGSCITLPKYNNSDTKTLSLVNGAYYCNIDIGGSTKITVPPGTYWVNTFSVGGSADANISGVTLYITGIGSNNGNPAFKVGGSGTLNAEGTMIYIKSGGFDLMGSGKITWTAPGSGPYQGLALYMDRANSSEVEQGGSARLMDQSGTWYAPASHCRYHGSTDTTIYSQFICSTIEVDGSSELTVKYDSAKVFQKETEAGVPSVGLVQ